MTDREKEERVTLFFRAKSRHRLFLSSTMRDRLVHIRGVSHISRPTRLMSHCEVTTRALIFQHPQGHFNRVIVHFRRVVSFRRHFRYRARASYTRGHGFSLITVTPRSRHSGNPAINPGARVIYRSDSARGEIIHRRRNWTHHDNLFQDTISASRRRQNGDRNFLVRVREQARQGIRARRKMQTKAPSSLLLATLIFVVPPSPPPRPTICSISSSK